MKSSKKIKYDEVKQILTGYLKEHNYRKTPERYAILKEIYSFPGHFCIKSLYQRMKTTKYLVSRATLYNTLKTLLECHLVIKHQFGNTTAWFEKSFGQQHYHMVCVDCGKVIEFTDYPADKSIFQLQEKLEKLGQVEITHHSLIFYGKCLNIKKCQKSKENIDNKTN